VNNRTLGIVLFLAACLPVMAGERLFENSDWEMGDLTNWTAEGAAFANQPVKGDNVFARTRTVHANHQGEYWIGTFEQYDGSAATTPGGRQGDRPTGTLTSVPFMIRHDRIQFLIGGGKYERETCVQLLIGERVVRTASGRNRDTMEWVTWNVATLKGREARIRIVDLKAGGWGHINTDAFMYADNQAGTAAQPGAAPPERPEKPGQPEKTEKQPVAPPERGQREEATKPIAYPTGTCMANIAPLLPGTTQHEAQGSQPDGYCKVRMQVHTTIEAAFAFYVQEMPRKGWQKVQEMRAGDGSMLVFHRGDEAFHVTAWPSLGYVDITYSAAR